MNNFSPISPKEVEYAAKRVEPFVINTPIYKSSILNELLGHEILFKCEVLQKTGAFKIRGAFNKILKLKEEGNLPNHIVAFSSGNHSQAVAYVANLFNIKATIFLPDSLSSIKIQGTKRFSAQVIFTKTRAEAEERAHALVEKENATLIPPFDDDAIHVGQGTAIYEVLKTEENIDAIFSPIGGGGLITGTYLAKELLSPKSQVFACEPLMANDAARSLRENQIVGFKDFPNTIADGARTLAIGKTVLPYLRLIDKIIEISEKDIIYWTQWLTHLLKLNVEPTAALAMAGAASWLKEQNSKQKILVTLSGGNISRESYRKIWQEDYLANQISL